jgi:hypothetical protein
MEVGSIWPVDTRGGRSKARWRVPAAVKSPARLLGTIGEGGVRVVLGAQWRSLRAIVIWL